MVMMMSGCMHAWIGGFGFPERAKAELRSGVPRPQVSPQSARVHEVRAYKCLVVGLNATTPSEVHAPPEYQNASPVKREEQERHGSKVKMLMRSLIEVLQMKGTSPWCNPIE